MLLPNSSSASLEAITSLSLIFRDDFEESPYGFEVIERAFDGRTANLTQFNYSNSDIRLNRQIYLCIHRGSGAPIQQLSIIQHSSNQDRDERLPPGYIELKHTPFGRRADLQSTPSNIDTSANVISTFLCFKPDIQSVINQFKDISHEKDDIALLITKCCTIFSCALYSGENALISGVLECFQLLPIPLISSPLLNLFIQVLCDCTPCFATHFTTESHSELLKFLLDIFRQHLSQLSLGTVMKMFECCFLSRHEDKHSEISIQMFQHLFKHIPRLKPCACQQQQNHGNNHQTTPPTAQQQISSPQRGHSKKKDKFDDITNVNSSRAQRYAVNSAQSSPPTTTVSSGSNSRSHSRRPSAIARLGANASTKPLRFTCIHCRWQLALTNSTSFDYCAHLIQRLLDNVILAKSLEIHVKRFQRHISTAKLFRLHISQLVHIFIEQDQIDEQTLKNFVHSRQHGNTSNQSGYTSSTRLSLTNIHPDLINFSFKEDRIFYSLTLMCCKFITENAGFNLKKSELIKRKIHGLRLLLYIFQNSKSFFHASRISLFVIRCFICPALLNACITDIPIIFRLILSIFTYFYDEMQCDLMLELGVMLDYMFLNLLESQFCSIQQKKDILDVLTHILRTPQQVVQLWYNYDNHANSWKIYQRIVSILSKLAQGEIKSFTTDIQEYNHDSLRKHAIKLLVHLLHMQAQWCGIPGLKRNFDLPTIPLLHDDRRASVDVTTFMNSEHEQIKTNVNAAHARRASDVPSSSHNEISSGGHSRSVSTVDINAIQLSAVNTLQFESEQHDHATNADTSTTSAVSGELALASSPKSKSNSPAKDNSSISSDGGVTRSRIASNSTWNRRLDKQKADAQIISNALKLARTDKLKSALQYLKMVNPASAVPHELSRFLYEHDELDKAEIGDILGSHSDNLLNSEEYSALRSSYLSLLDFTGMTFDSALRVFLCESGFRLPGEAQKIDRLLESFCKAFCRDNLDVFRNESSAFIVAFALVMLNTDLHDPRLKTGSSQRKPMSLEQFMNNLRGVDDGHDFHPAFLTQLYNNIKQSPIEWKSKTTLPTNHSSSPSPTSSSATPPNNRDNDQHTLYQNNKFARDQATRRTFESYVRRACAYLKNHSAHSRAFNTSYATRIIQGVFEISWFASIASITATCETYPDIELLNLCMDGLAYGAVISIALGLTMERQAFTRVLAKLTFIEHHSAHLHSTVINIHDVQSLNSDLSRRLINGEHLKQEWYRSLSYQSDKYPCRACKIIFRICSEAKLKMEYQRRLGMIKKLQTQFGNEIQLISSNRTLIKHGQLTKIHSTTKRVTYYFFLFNDCLLYASAGLHSKYRLHRLIQLSLCRLENINSNKYGSNACFRLISSQKTIIVEANTEIKKQNWMDAIKLQIKLQIPKRNHFIQIVNTKINNLQQTTITPQTTTTNESLLINEIDNSIQSSSDDPALTSPSSSLVSQSDIGSFDFGIIDDVVDTMTTSEVKLFPHCSLCLRSYSMFRRRIHCRICNEHVCGECAQQRPNNIQTNNTVEHSTTNDNNNSTSTGTNAISSIEFKGKICDACAGVLSGVVNLNSPLFSNVDT